MGPHTCDIRSAPKSPEHCDQETPVHVAISPISMHIGAARSGAKDIHDPPSEAHRRDGLQEEPLHDPDPLTERLPYSPARHALARGKHSRAVVHAAESPERQLHPTGYQSGSSA